MLNFKRDSRVGTIRRPFVIQTSEATDISEALFDARSQLVVYAITGQVVFRGKASDFDRHSLLDGVYIVSETRPDGTVISRSRSFISHRE